MAVFKVFYDSSRSSENSESFTSLIYFSSLIAFARNSKPILNNSDQSGYPCLVPDFRGNVFSYGEMQKSVKS